MLAQRRAERMGAIALGHKIQGIGISRLKDCPNGRLSRQCDGRRWQTTDDVGVVRVTRIAQVGSLQVAVVAFTQTINDRRVRLQTHTLSESLEKHTGNERSL